jgi:hypothetical protein
MLKYSHPTLAVFVEEWPSMILVPAVLLLIVALAVTTRVWDRRDQATRASTSRARPATTTDMINPVDEVSVELSEVSADGR